MQDIHYQIKSLLRLINLQNWFSYQIIAILLKVLLSLNKIYMPTLKIKLQWLLWNNFNACSFDCLAYYETSDDYIIHNPLAYFNSNCLMKTSITVIWEFFFNACSSDFVILIYPFLMPTLIFFGIIIFKCLDYIRTTKSIYALGLVMAFLYSLNGWSKRKLTKWKLSCSKDEKEHWDATIRN